MNSADQQNCPLTRVAALLKSAAEHHRWKEYDASERLCREAIDVARAELGGEHQALGTALCDLGTTLSEQGRVFEAREAYTEALTILEKRLGNSDPSVLWVFAHLHDLYR